MRYLLALLFIAENARPRRETQARVLASIRKFSGSPVGRFIEDSELAAGTVHYHLERLEKRGIIRTVVVGRRRLVFLASDVALQMDPEALAILRGRTARAIAHSILAQEDISISALVASVAGSPRAVYYHVKRLRELGLLAADAPRRYRGLSPTPKLRLLFAQIESTEATDDPETQGAAAPGSTSEAS